MDGDREELRKRLRQKIGGMRKARAPTLPEVKSDLKDVDADARKLTKLLGSSRKEAKRLAKRLGSDGVMRGMVESMVQGGEGQFMPEFDCAAVDDED